MDRSEIEPIAARLELLARDLRGKAVDDLGDVELNEEADRWLHAVDHESVAMLTGEHTMMLRWTVLSEQRAYQERFSEVSARWLPGDGIAIDEEGARRLSDDPPLGGQQVTFRDVSGEPPVKLRDLTSSDPFAPHHPTHRPWWRRLLRR